MRSKTASIEQIGGRGRGDQRAVGELEHVAEGIFADQNGQQRAGALAVGGGSGGPACHLDEGVVAALGRGAGQVGDGGGVAVDGLGCRPVDLEQVTFEAFELGADLGLGRAGELAGEETGAAEAVVQGDLAVVTVGLVGVGIAVLASVAEPVAAGLGEVGPPHRAGLADEVVLGVGKGSEGVGGGEDREAAGVGHGDVTRGERGRGVGHRPQPAGEVHVGAGIADRRVIAGRQPRRGGQVPGVGPRPLTIDQCGQSGFDGAQLRPDPAQLDQQHGGLVPIEGLDVDRGSAPDAASSTGAASAVSTVPNTCSSVVDGYDADGSSDEPGRGVPNGSHGTRCSSTTGTVSRHHPVGPRADALLLAGELAVLDLRLDVVAVHVGDEVDRDLLRARLLALAVVRARAEELLHRVDHVDGARVALGLALGQQVEVLQLGRREQLGRAVGARGDARPAADAGRGVHGGVADLLGDGIRLASGAAPVGAVM